MAIADTLNASVYIKLAAGLARAQTYGGVQGKDSMEVSKTNSFTDGTSASQATGWFSSQFTATTGGITVSLANADPLGGAGDDTPTGTVEGTKLRAIVITNEDATNYITVAPGTNGVTSWLAGTTPTIRVPAGGLLVSTFPAGLDTLNDGADEELSIVADTSSVVVKIAYLFG